MYRKASTERKAHTGFAFRYPLFNKKVRLRIVPYVAAGLYLALSIWLFFGTLGTASHAYWPILLLFITFPVGLLGFEADTAFVDWFIPGSSPNWMFTLNDYIMGAYFIIVGTLWIRFLGRLVCLFITWLFPITPDPDA